MERFALAPGPAMLLIEGEAGIGKTTLWLHGVSVTRATGKREALEENRAVLAACGSPDAAGRPFTWVSPPS